MSANELRQIIDDIQREENLSRESLERRYSNPSARYLELVETFEKKYPQKSLTKDELEESAISDFMVQFRDENSRAFPSLISSVLVSWLIASKLSPTGSLAVFSLLPAFSIFQGLSKSTEGTPEELLDLETPQKT